MTIKDPTGRLARWAAYIQAFQFEIIYRKGKANSNADALSRPVTSNYVYSILNSEYYASTKALDPFEDDNLIYFLKYRKHSPGLAVKHIKRIEKTAKHYKLDIDDLGNLTLYYHQDDKAQVLIVPKPEEREELIFNPKELLNG